MIDVKKIADMLIDAVMGPPPAAATPLPNTGLAVDAGDGWIPVTRDVWSAWTGRRAVWGVEYHGPVHALGAPEGSPPFAGARLCRCATCQSGVDPSARPN